MMTPYRLKQPPKKHLTFTLKVGSQVLISRRDRDGFSIHSSELWTVTAVGKGFVQFHSDNGDHVRMLR